MTVFLLLVCAVFVTATIQMILKKRFLLKNLLVSLIALVLIVTHTIGALVNRQNIRTFDEQFCSTLVTIPWHDTEYLENVGFKRESGDFLDYYYKSDACLEKDNLPCVQFSIQIRKMEKESAIEQFNLLPYGEGNLYIKQNANLLYNNFLFRFLGIPNCIDRDCDVYYNGYLIWIYEKNYESLNHSWAEEFIYGLNKNTGNTGDGSAC